MYQIMHDDTFLNWPPTPQLAMTLFPYVRSVYYNLWLEFVLPYEVKFNRQILGLPPVEQNNDRQNAAEQRRRAQGNEEGGLAGLLQGILDALDPDDDDDDDEPRLEFMQGHMDANGGAGEDGELMIELRIEEVEHIDADEGQDQAPIHAQVELNADAVDGQHGDPAVEAVDQAEDLDLAQAAAAEGGAPANEGANVGQPEDHGEGGAQHEVPQAPPVRRMGLGAMLSNMSNTVVGALILPGVSFAMGEALRLVLPKAWTSSASRNPWSLYSGVGGRPGLLQQQWGRSLVGGCVYVVLRDMIRVYAKSRRVAAMGNRRVKNVERNRGKK
jgi:hypothetical protein